MSENDACPLPSAHTGGPSDALSRMLDAKRIAVVGLSDDSSRPSYDVASYLRSVGKEVIPVNPTHKSVMGLTCYPSLAAVPGPIDLVAGLALTDTAGTITIVGPTNGSIVIRRNLSTSDRFSVLRVNTGVSAEFRNLTISNGRAATESTTTMSTLPERTSVSVISRPCSPVSGCEIRSSSISTPSFLA